MSHLKDKIKEAVFHIAFEWKKKGKTPIRVKSIDETIDDLIRSDKSLVRFGDAEIWIIEGRTTKFQNYDPQLAVRLKEIISYQTDDILVGIPDIFENLDPYTKKSRKFWEEHVFFSRKTYEKYCNRDKVYENAFFSRPYYIYEDKMQSAEWFKKIKEIWKGKDVVIVEGEGTHSGVGNDLLDTANAIERIICPGVNAYFAYDKIKGKCMEFDKGKLFLFALGNTAKLLVCDLVTEGYRAIDIGNLDMEYEWYLQKAESKVPVPKHSVTGREENLKAGYTAYLEQIRAEITL